MRTKKFMSLLMAAVLLISSVCMVASADGIVINGYQLGDVNMDGELSYADASLILGYCSGSASFTYLQKLLADYNQDGVVNTGDAAAILRDTEIVINGYRLGDVNMDGHITNDDATLVLHYCAGTSSLTYVQKLLADYNQDGTVNTGDATAILKAVEIGIH